jgi:hypothetical protein
MGAKPADDTYCNIRKIRMMAEGFTGMYVGKVNFNKGYFNGRQGIAQRHRSMGEGSRIDDHKIDRVSGEIMHLCNQLRFGIALKRCQRYTMRIGLLLQTLVDRLQSIVAVMVRFSQPQHIEVGTMQYENGRYRISNHGSGILRTGDALSWQQVCRKLGDIVQ